jgi:hypothetical protein
MRAPWAWFFLIYVRIIVIVVILLPVLDWAGSLTIMKNHVIQPSPPKKT